VALTSTSLPPPGCRSRPGTKRKTPRQNLHRYPTSAGQAAVIHDYVPVTTVRNLQMHWGTCGISTIASGTAACLEGTVVRTVEQTDISRVTV